MTLLKVTERVYFLPNEQETDRPLLGYIKGHKYSLMNIFIGILLFNLNL